MFDRERPNGRVAHHDAPPEESGDAPTIVMAAFSSLTPRQQEVMALRFGFADGRELTQIDVAIRLGVSQPTIAITEERAMRRLRQAFDTDVA